MMNTSPKIMLIGLLIVLWLGRGLLFSASPLPVVGAGSHGFELNISVHHEDSVAPGWSISVAVGGLLLNAVWKP
jgi:hypothetical protein